jgi:hypothetical protein
MKRCASRLGAKALAVIALVWPALVFSAPGSDEQAQAAAEPKLHLQVKEAGGALQVKYSLRNGNQPILVYNRLCRIENKAVVRDPAPLQRFIYANTLRLYLGRTPDDASVGFANVPHVTKLAPHATLTGSARLPIPTSEYSDSVPETPKFVETHVDDVIMFVHYVPAKGVKLERSRLYPDAFMTVDGDSWDRIGTARSNIVPLTLRVLRVEQPADFDRLYVKGDK